MLPETEYLRRHSRDIKSLKGQQYPVATLLRRFTELEPTSNPIPPKLHSILSDGDESSMESDPDDSSYTTEEPSSPVKSSVRPGILDEDAMSHTTSLREIEQEEPDQQLALELPRLGKPEQPEVSLCKLFSDPEPLALMSSSPTMIWYKLLRFLLSKQPQAHWISAIGKMKRERQHC